MRAAGRGRPLAVAVLHLTALWGLALVQPLLQLLGDTPEFFVARGNTGGDIVLGALALTLIPPALLGLIELAVTRVNARAGWFLHLTLVGVLVTLIALPLVGDLGPAWLAICLAATLGAAAAMAYARFAPMRSFTTVLAFAPAAFVLSFLLLSPVSDLVFPSESRTEARAAEESTPVVMVLFDEFPLASLIDEHRRIDAERFPAFARLARDATWYRNATTVSGSTAEAVPAVMSGLVPGRGDLPLSRDYPRNLFTMLARSHEMKVLEPYTDVCPDWLCEERDAGMLARFGSLASDLSVVSLHLMLPTDLRDGIPAIDRTWGDFRDPAAVGGAIEKRDVLTALSRESPISQFGRFVDGFESSSTNGQPPLNFVHLPFPHGPWTRLPTGQQYQTAEGGFPGLGEDNSWTTDEGVVGRALERHMLQVGLADRLIGKMLHKLQEADLYDRALVVVTADHGASFRPGDYRRDPTEGNLAEIAGVPLFVKLPQQDRGAIDDRGARTVDVLPTIATVLGAGRGWEFDGKPLGSGVSRDQVEMYEDGAPSVSTSLVAFEKSLALASRQHRRQLRDAKDVGGGGFYLRGPRPDLIGLPLSDLTVRTMPRGSGSLTAPDAWANVDRSASLLPIEVTAMSSAVEAGDAVVIALNGVVVATATATRSGNTSRITALLPWTALRDGRNEVVIGIPLGARSLRGVARSAAH